MKNTGTLKVSMPSDREIAMTRVFTAPRHLVFDAFSKPELLTRWQTMMDILNQRSRTKAIGSRPTPGHRHSRVLGAR